MPILSDRMLLGQVEDLAGRVLPDAVAMRLRFYPARRRGRGDVSTDAAMVAGQPALVLAERLARLPDVLDAHVAGPGFVNLRYADAALDRILPALLNGRSANLHPAGALTVPPEAMRRNNPDFMVQYAHARCRSVLRAAAAMPEFGWEDAAGLAAAARGWFLDGPPRALLCRLDHWMRLVEAPGYGCDNVRITLFLRDLSVEFDRMWMLSRDGATMRLLHLGQPARSLAYLALVLATADAIRSGLGLLGMEAAEEIR
jgi:arginyl-tRNA synthetase